MENLARRLGLKTDPTIFFASAGFTIVFVIALVLFPEPIGDAFAVGRSWIVVNLGWFFILGVNVWLGFLIWAAASRLRTMSRRPPRFSNLAAQPFLVVWCALNVMLVAVAPTLSWTVYSITLIGIAR